MFGSPEDVLHLDDLVLETIDEGVFGSYLFFIPRFLFQEFFPSFEELLVQVVQVTRGCLRVCKDVRDCLLLSSDFVFEMSQSFVDVRSLIRLDLNLY